MRRNLSIYLLFALSVAGGAADLSFRNDVLPILARAGCAAGSCHAKAGGQNGFQLSIFAYDPASDYREIVHGARGRRVFPAAPDESLLLLKATQSMDHEGGRRIEPGSDFHRVLREWIAQGLPWAATNEVSLTRIEVSPGTGRYGRGAELELKVTAHYSDDSTRDVTRLAEYRSNDEAMAIVDHDGRVTLGGQSGEGVIIVRYMDQVGNARVTVPGERRLPDSAYAGLPIRNEIDKLVYARHRELGLLASGECSDSEFLRRASLDAVGKLPTPEVARDYLLDFSADKRAKLIDELLADPDWADHWAVKFGDLIRPNTQRVGVKPVYLLDGWLRRRLRENVPYDALVKELLTASGSTHQYGPVAFFRDKREPATAGAFVSRIFLGVRLDCAQCHHHPSEKWGQDDYYRFAAFFGSMKRKGQGISAPISGEPEYWWWEPGGTVRHPVTDEVMPPRPLDGVAVEIPTEKDPRSVLIDWMLTPDNPFFAKAIVNRVWGEFFGVGIVEPVDDFRESNPPSNDTLLDWLARDFVENGYDLKHLMRRILRSNVYGLSSMPNETNAADRRNNARSLRRRLPAEVMADAVASFTGTPEKWDGLPPGARAVQTWNTRMSSTFLDTFGRPDFSAECPCERDPAPTIVQSLHLMNSDELQSRLSAADGRAAALAAGDAGPEEIVRQIYLAAYARPPTVDELRVASGAFSGDGVSRQGAIEDIMWALINSAEFVFNH
ncbi:MAG: DUF1553 domain-containing protein [Verrucomicrobiae bacterium]|nr:DUF1553 domain-containing protein [Verrucomicrobiae bacterium]